MPLVKHVFMNLILFVAIFTVSMYILTPTTEAQCTSPNSTM
jgi:hypothetical protein